MRNKHPGPCYRCGEMVDAGAGHFERIRPGEAPRWSAARWRVQHAECAIFYRGTGINAEPLPRPTPAMMRAVR